MVRTMASSLLALGLFLGLGLATPAAIADEDQPRRVTVTGQAEIQAAPDIATLSIGVEIEAKTPGEALAANAARMTAVTKRLKQAGIADKDMQTSQLGIWPIYADRQQPRKTVAYRVSNQLTVTIRDIDRLGATLDQAVADGANSVGGPTFAIADPEPLLAKAREAAVRDAIAKAERYAAAAEVELGEVLSIDEGSGGGPIFTRHMRAESMTASTPVAPGETTIAASVTLTFAIR
ncbi:MAG: SIMPL domain-containing protein [Alphaproteobacteria bacterium]|nr:SIMPL domain-containing protein [Alphaproteobacteria bacterium]